MYYNITLQQQTNFDIWQCVLGATQSRAAKDEHARMDSGQNKENRIRNEKFRSNGMVKTIITYVTQKRIWWYGHGMSRDDMTVAKEVTTVKVGGKRPRGRPRLRWMDGGGAI